MKYQFDCTILGCFAIYSYCIYILYKPQPQMNFLFIDDIANLLHILVYLNETCQAETVQAQFELHLSIIESLCPLVWIGNNNKDSTQLENTVCFLYYISNYLL